MPSQGVQNLPSSAERVEGATIGLTREAGGAAPEASDSKRPAAGVSERGGMLAQELWLRSQARHAASIAASLDDADALLIPLVLSLARLGAQRDAREQGQRSPFKVGEV